MPDQNPDPQQQQMISFAESTTSFPIGYHRHLDKYTGDGWRVKSFTTAVFNTVGQYETTYKIVVTALLERPMYAR